MRFAIALYYIQPPFLKLFSKPLAGSLRYWPLIFRGVQPLIYSELPTNPSSSIPGSAFHTFVPQGSLGELLQVVCVHAFPSPVSSRGGNPFISQARSRAIRFYTGYALYFGASSSEIFFFTFSVVTILAPFDRYLNRDPM